MIEELIARVFATRNAAHIAHWKAKGTGSYARHMALGNFYDGIIDKLDGIVEMHQGAFGLISSVKSAPAPTGDIVAHLEEEATWLGENREDIADENPAIENAVDDLAGLYWSTLYKLKNLQ